MTRSKYLLVVFLLFTSLATLVQAQDEDSGPNPWCSWKRLQSALAVKLLRLDWYPHALFFLNTSGAYLQEDPGHLYHRSPLSASENTGPQLPSQISCSSQEDLKRIINIIEKRELCQQEDPYNKLRAFMEPCILERKKLLRLSLTSIGDRCADIISDYIGHQHYPLPFIIIQTLQTLIQQKIPVPLDIQSVLPYCIDAENKVGFLDHLSYNMDPFIADAQRTNDWLMCYFENPEQNNTGRKRFLKLVEKHLLNLEQDPLFFSLDNTRCITAENKRSTMSEYDIFHLLLQDAVEHRKESDSLNYYKKVIRRYITMKPYLIQSPGKKKFQPRSYIGGSGLHARKEYWSLFDYINVHCLHDYQRIPQPSAPPSNREHTYSILSFLLENKLNVNMQDSHGNTYLHTLVKALPCWKGASSCEHPYHSEFITDNSLFIQQCGPYLNLTIKNHDSQTVFDLLEVKLQDYYSHSARTAYFQCQALQTKLLFLHHLNKNELTPFS